MYFSLKDEGSVLQSVMFRSANNQLKFEPQNGMRVLCCGRISVFDKRGQYQLYVDKIEPKGIGALELAFQKLKEKLFKEGLFDEARKRPVPFLPDRIGIVTSPTGAAIRDILNIAKRRFSNIEIIINPVKVQGEGAGDEIANAIAEFNKEKMTDVIILARGGGSLEDLWPFNEEVVARAVFASEIPLVSAVGHEIDWTISDFVADLRAPTPSAAAEILIPMKEDLADKVQNALTRLNNALQNTASQYGQRIDEIVNSMTSEIGHVLELKARSFQIAVGKLESLSPLGVLARGYSITSRADGGVLKDAAMVKRDDIIKTRLVKGYLLSKIKEVKY